MSKSKIAVAIISLGTGEDPKNLRRCLSSVMPYTDGFFITLTGPKQELGEAEKVCKEFGAHVSYTQALWEATEDAVLWLTEYLKHEPHMKVGDRLFLFDQARNFNFSQIPKKYEWILWIDTDDVLMKGQNLWKLKEIGDQVPTLEGFFLKYVYRALLDKKGNIKEVLIEHLRERFIRNTKRWKWVAPIHESLIANPSPVMTEVEDCFILHMITSEHIQNSLERNMKNLELAVYQTKGKDPRHVYNLAKGYIDLRTKEYNERALPLLFEFLWGQYQSEWPEERAEAYENLGEIYRNKGQYNKAIKSYLKAFTEEPARASIYLNLALTFLDKQDWDNTLHWLNLAGMVEEKKTTLTKNPRDAKVIKLSAEYTALLNKGKTVEAYNAVQKLLKITPNDPSVRVVNDFITKKKQKEELATAVKMIQKHLELI